MIRVNTDDVPVSLRPYVDVVAEISHKSDPSGAEKFDYWQLPDRADFIDSIFSSVCFGNLAGNLSSSKNFHHDKEWNRWYRRWSHRALSDQHSDANDLLIDRDQLLHGVSKYLENPDLRSSFLDWYCADTVAYAEYISTFKALRHYGGGVLTRGLVESERVSRKLTGLGARSIWWLVKWGIWLALLAGAASVGWWAAIVVLAVTFWTQFQTHKAHKKVSELLFAMRATYDVFQSQAFSWEVAWLELNRSRELGALWPGELYKLVELRRRA